MEKSTASTRRTTRRCCVGEPAVTVVAPAIANAIYNAVGARVRSLPITAEAVKAAMKT
jgi:isoquinoline 1-oxidoreductase